MPPQPVSKWKTFEDTVAFLYELSGANIVKQNYNMLGYRIDIFLEHKSSSNKITRSIVECKFQQKQVEEKGVTSFALIANHLKEFIKIDNSIIVAYNGFSNNAHTIAKMANIELISFAELEENVQKLNIDFKKLFSIKYNYYGPTIINKPFSFDSVLNKFILNSEKKILPKKFKKTLFVLMPFKKELDDHYKYGIIGSAKKFGLKCVRADEIEHNSDILEEITDYIKKATIIVAEVSDHNPNVFYEIGYAHALGIEPILIAKKGSKIPFDLQSYNHIIYSSISSLEEKLSKRIKSLVSK